MKRRIALLLAVALLPLAAVAQALPDTPQPAAADNSGWIRVQSLSHGDSIEVARPGGGLAVPCRFAGATDGTLFCDSVFGDRQYRIDRADINRIRRDDKRRNLHITIGALAAAGLVWGVATPPSPGSQRVLNAAVGAGAGAFAGLLVSLPVAFLVPGRTVYVHRRAAAASAALVTP